ncbi:MAG: transporter periplasmic component-like protein [Ramlibacter sp.]|jgi:phospholipid/cholesterol/gamma-HCH transport system substrate-binding protein|nr:transporter periplasmic component-like protein [Ramlibacter sp.]MCE3271837.1 transporter periplasmic component-like protein [Ramlibacter sp.]
MENKAHALAAGIFVALLTALVLALAAWLTRDTGARDSYEISTRETVSGLQEQAPVRFRGVDVGKVREIGFDPKVAGNVLIRLEVDRETPLTRGSFATLSYQGVTGLAFVQLSDDGKPSPRLEPNDEVPPRIPLRPGLLQRLEEKGEVILEQVQTATERVNALLDDTNQKRIASALENIARASDSANQLAKSLDSTVNRRLDPALAEATTTMRGLQKAADQVGVTAAQFGKAAERMNAPGGPFDRISEGTDALSGAAENLSVSTLPRVNRAADDTGRAARTLTRTLNQLSDNPQSLVYGDGAVPPGPGEPGFQVPGSRK